MKKIFIVFLSCFLLLSCITPVQYHIIDKGNVVDTTFATEYVKTIGEIGHCKHPVILCERIDSLLGTKKVKWADDEEDSRDGSPIRPNAKRFFFHTIKSKALGTNLMYSMPCLF